MKSDRSQPLDFVLVGPFKTGTTWLDNYLRSRPEISLPSHVKETFYYSDDKIYARGQHWLDSLFEDSTVDRLRGEVGPSYFSRQTALDRIYRDNQNCKIICSVREPASRLHSFYLHQLQRGDIPSNTIFSDYITQMPTLLESAKYGTYLIKWQEYFGMDNVTVLRYEDLTEAPQKLIDQLCSALQISPSDVGDLHEKRVNKALRPTNPKLAKLAYVTARLLRRAGMHRSVSALRDSAVHRMLFTQYNTRPVLTDDGRKAVYEKLGDELCVFKERTDGKISW